MSGVIFVKAAADGVAWASAAYRGLRLILPRHDCKWETGLCAQQAREFPVPEGASYKAVEMGELGERPVMGDKHALRMVWRRSLKAAAL